MNSYFYHNKVTYERLCDRGVVEQRLQSAEIRSVSFACLLNLPVLWAQEADVAAAALTITSQREEAIDFTVPFYTEPSVVVLKVRARSGGPASSVVLGGWGGLDSVQGPKTLSKFTEAHIPQRGEFRFHFCISFHFYSDYLSE